MADEKTLKYLCQRYLSVGFLFLYLFLLGGGTDDTVAPGLFISATQKYCIS